MDFSEKMLGMSFSCFTIYSPQRLTPLPTDTALLQCLCCAENTHNNVPASERLCTETGLPSEQSSCTNPCFTGNFCQAKLQFDKQSQVLDWLLFFLLWPLDICCHWMMFLAATKWLAMVGSNIFLWNEHFCQRCQPKAQHCCFLKIPDILNYLNHTLFNAKSPSHLPAACSGQSMCQTLLSCELRPHSVPNRICWGLCSPPWTSGERRGCRHIGLSRLAFHKVPTDFYKVYNRALDLKRTVWLPQRTVWENQYTCMCSSPTRTLTTPDIGIPTDQHLHTNVFDTLILSILFSYSSLSWRKGENMFLLT